MQFVIVLRYLTLRELTQVPRRPKIGCREWMALFGKLSLPWDVQMAKDKTKKKALGPKAVGPKPKKTPCDKLELDDEAEWAELEKDAMSAERFDAIAEYLRSSGQASA